MLALFLCILQRQTCKNTFTTLSSKSLIKKILYITAFLFTCSNLLAQEKFHHHFTVDDGLPSNVVYKVIQDEDGFIWVCTEKGVAVYDGYNFKPINKNQLQLSSNDVWELIIDRYNRKWFFTMDADPVIIIKGKAYKLNDLAPQSGGNLYPWSLNTYTFKYATNSDFLLLNKYDTSAHLLNENNKIVNIQLPKEIIQKIISRDILHFAILEKKIIITHFSGKEETFNLEGKLISSHTSLPIGEVAEILQVENFKTNIKSVYFKDEKHLYEIENEKVKKLNYNVSAQNVFRMIGTSQDNIFLKEEEVLYTLNKKNNSKSFFSKSIKGARQIFEDNEKNIWIASQEDGMYLIPYHANKTKIYNETNGLAYPKITAMAFDNKGLLYLGNNYGTSISIFDNGTFSTFPKQNLKDYFIHTDQDNNVWLSGINLIADRKIKMAYNMKTGVRNKSTRIGNKWLNEYAVYPKSICQNGNQFFFGRLRFYRVTLKNQTAYFDSITKFKNTIYAIEAKSANEIFIGTTNGIYIMNTESEKSIKINEKYLAGNIRDMKFVNNQLWVATDLHGLVIYDPNSKKSSVIKELKGKTISDIHKDSIKNTKWISTNNGLFRIKYKSPTDYAIKQYTTTNGLPSNEINCCLTRNNKVYIGTARGLAIMPDEEVDLSYKAKIFQTRFNVNNEDLPISTSYNLNHDENHIIIELTALSFSSLGNVTYRYRLQGADDTWSEGKNRTLEFPNLPPGKYTLLANAKDANGQETSNQVKIEINIKPPLTQTWWFQLLAGLFLSGLISTFIYWRSKENNKKNLLEKQFSNLKLAALQSQLNSHFIFNALNAIQAYIIQKDERQASKYMSQFAKLMRAFLDSSRNRTISIQDEIDFLKTYISLEQIIYDDKFESEIFIDEALDTSQKIPSNITQPFVENAILHGLMPIKRKGHLKIFFNTNQGFVAQCKIEDDGVGYNSSQKNKTIKSKSHGQNIIHERIAILKKDHQLDVDIEIIDRKKQSNKDGTIIIINFKNNGAD